MNLKWIALFSQSGSEIANLAEKLNRWPDIIITNSKKIIDDRIENRGYITLKSQQDYIKAFGLNSEDCFVTLHGWLRIIPADICNKYRIFNGHPGLITKYPKLKGKDPQKRAFEGNYKEIGCVVHRVIPKVDSGEVLLEAVHKNKPLSSDETFDILKQKSLGLWEDFFKEKLYL